VLGESARMQDRYRRKPALISVRYVLHDGPGSGYCHQLMRRDDAVIVMTDGTYTTCEPGKPWRLHSKDIELNREEGAGAKTST